jgi:hypothetical protein
LTHHAKRWGSLLEDGGGKRARVETANPSAGPTVPDEYIIDFPELTVEDFDLLDQEEEEIRSRYKDTDQRCDYL